MPLIVPDLSQAPVGQSGRQSPPWRLITTLGFLLTSLMIFDVYRRTLYVALTEAGAMTGGEILLATSLAHLRVRSLA
jgi:hypothetical protein